MTVCWSRPAQRIPIIAIRMLDVPRPSAGARQIFAWIAATLLAALANYSTDTYDLDATHPAYVNPIEPVTKSMIWRI